MSANLTVMLSAASEVIPVTQSIVRVYNSDGRMVYEQFLNTESEGKSNAFLLDTPKDAETLEPETDMPQPYSTYTVTVRSENYYQIRVEGVQMFDGSPSTLPVEMIPLPVPGLIPENYPPLVYHVGANVLNQDSPRPEAPDASELPPVLPAQKYEPTILSSVYIPAQIRVHLGPPDSNAETVTASFPDYIKNVASSEIYPTWPEESLKANIYAQISLALNRIFTEWYPSRGYSFDITNSTAYDQYYVQGRNIFDNISRLVDEIFNVYFRRPNRIEPFFAEYCNGSSVSCAGMSQWGTVSLAQQGLTAEEILAFYYGDIELTSTNDIRDIEQSYPGTPLRLGSSGIDVRTVQMQLARVAINYPSIGISAVDGIFGPKTQQQVINFQRLFVLTPDGIVGKETWYRLSYLYTAVKKLAELTSEGQREEYNTTEYPGFVLRRGTKGNEVQQIQFYLSRIAAFNPSIPSGNIDGIYGASTENIVSAFQRYYGLSADGEVGRVTWNRIVDVYLGTTDSDGSSENISLTPYPGTVQKRGMRGENVLYIQRILNAVSGAFVTLPKVVADGAFGALTENAVVAFQRLFGLSADGIVGRQTWNRMNDVYNAVDTGCLLSSPPAAGLQSYPGYVLYIGSSGSYVSYVQRLLQSIATAIPGIGSVSVDGAFGRGTQNVVKNFQSTFGLSADGSVGAATWSLLNDIYSAVQGGCLPRASSAASAEPDGEEEATLPVAKEEASPLSFRSNPLCVGAFGQAVVDFKKLFTSKTGVELPEGMLYGLRTARAVSEYQRAHGLEASGKADSDTVASLM